jgi:methionyl-tRNA formyltransferase
MKTALGMDTGDIVSVSEVEIGEDTYVDELFTTLSKVGAQLLIDTIDEYVSGKIVPIPQNEDEATKCRMLTKEDAKLDFSKDAKTIINRMRGMGYGYFIYKDEMVKVYNAKACETQGDSAKIITHDKLGVLVGCKNGSVLFTELQMPGKKRLDAKAFANGIKMEGEVF